MTDKDLVNKGKQERQATMDKLSIDAGTAYTYDPEDSAEGSGCLKDVDDAREARQRQMDRETA